MVAVVEQGHSLMEAMIRLKKAGAINVDVIEFTRFLRFEGLSKDEAEAVEGIGKAAETARELVG